METGVESREAPPRTPDAEADAASVLSSMIHAGSPPPPPPRAFDISAHALAATSTLREPGRKKRRRSVAAGANGGRWSDEEHAAFLQGVAVHG